MNDDAAILEFENRDIFRKWLQKNHNTSNGIWIVFIKGEKSFSANDALEEAICFGWIDGIMKSINVQTYKKYFSKRKDKKKWSEKNIKIFKKLKEEGLITEAGLDAFQGKEKEENNNRDAINKMNIEKLIDALKNDHGALNLFEKTPPSRQKQLAGFYCDAKSEETRNKRMKKIIEALNTGNRGMLY
jgi:uncharacterized protein YdeI (YjbR/CyaY-like superfamily)